MAADPGWDWLPGAVIPFGWKAFRAKYRLLREDEGLSLGFAGQVAGRLGLWGVNQVAWALDEVAARGWRDVAMAGPVFIVGHQRSGTTLLHRLLAEDTVHARALQFQEMILPASSFQRTLAAAGRMDARWGGRLAAWFQRRQEALFSPMDPIHRIRFDEIEEDEFVLWGIFMSAMCANDAPVSVSRRELDWLREFHGWPVDEQQRALGWYRACLMKKVHREPPVGEEPVWVVAKNPAFSHKIPELLKVFPDARIVHLVRNPLETIPSRLSLIRAIWRQRIGPDIDMTGDQVEVILRDSVRTYVAAHRDLAALPEDRWITVRYEALREDLADVIERIYGQLRLPVPGEALREAVAARTERDHARHSAHEYSLEEFGLSEARIRDELGGVMAAHGFA